MNPEADYNLHLIKSQMGMASDLKGLKAAASAGASDEAAKKWKAAQDFQALFLGQMYKSMRKSVMGSELTQASSGREIFTEMLDQEYAKMDSRNPSETGATGMDRALSGISNSLAAQIYRSLMRQDGQIPAMPARPAPAPDTEALPFSAAAAAAKSLGARKAQPAKSPTLSEDVLEPIVDLASRTYGVAKNLIKGVIGQESAGQPLAVSAVGAKGLMQLMDSTAADLGVKNPFNARENVMGGTRYLKQMLQKFGGDEKLALAAYNAGPGAVDRFGGIPPYAETRNYVEKVLKAKARMDMKDGAGRAEDGALGAASR